MHKAIEYSAVWSVGAIGYCLLEIVWRGFTHWTMGVTGGICLVALYLIESIPDSPRWKRCLAGALAITLTELAVGFIVNLLLGWQVWDYSALHFNFCGQISLLYTALWFLLCIPAGYLCEGLHRLLDRMLAVKPAKGSAHATLSHH